MKVLDIVNYLDNRFPVENASDFDVKCTGFIIGSKNNEVNIVLCALDLTLDVAKQAIKKGANLVITHHPFLFNGTYKIDFDTEVGKTIKLLCENNISLYCVHTALDVASGGVNDVLAKRLGFKNIEGEVGKEKFLRVGDVNVSLIELANRVKKELLLDGVRIAGDKAKFIRKAGIVGGAGCNEIYEAKAKGCDCLITGEVRLNRAIEARQIGLTLIEANHGIERFVFEDLVKEFEKEFADVRFIVSDINTDPLYFV